MQIKNTNETGIKPIRNNTEFESLEKLFIQKKGTFDLEEIPLDSIDNSYKPGLYNEIKSFFGDSPRYLCTVDEQINNFYFYYKIANYEVT